MVVGEVLQRRDRPDPATLIGRGKVDEIAGAAKMAEADVLIFDHELSAPSCATWSANSIAAWSIAPSSFSISLPATPAPAKASSR